MSNKKHYIITSITLGLIGAASGALIGLSNLATKNAIAKNEINKINQGIAAIFGDNSSISDSEDITGYKYTNHLYHVDIDGQMGLALRTSGSNMYGKLSLIVGFKDDKFIGFYVVVNEQTYASTLVENYINTVNDGSRSLDDVTCGATYGAKLARDMVNEAKEVMEKVN